MTKKTELVEAARPTGSNLPTKEKEYCTKPRKSMKAKDKASPDRLKSVASKMIEKTEKHSKAEQTKRTRRLSNDGKAPRKSRSRSSSISGEQHIGIHGEKIEREPKAENNKKTASPSIDGKLARNSSHSRIPRGGGAGMPIEKNKSEQESNKKRTSLSKDQKLHRKSSSRSTSKSGEAGIPVPLEKKKIRRASNAEKAKKSTPITKERKAPRHSKTSSKGEEAGSPKPLKTKIEKESKAEKARNSAFLSKDGQPRKQSTSKGKSGSQKAGKSKVFKKPEVRRISSTSTSDTNHTASTASCSSSDSFREEEDNFLPFNESATFSVASTRFHNRATREEREAVKKAALAEKEAKVRTSLAAAFLAQDKENHRKQKEGGQPKKLDDKWWEEHASNGDDKQGKSQEKDFITDYEFDETEMLRTEIQAILHSDKQKSPQKHVYVALMGQRMESLDIFDVQWGMLRFAKSWNRKEINLVV